MSVPNAFELKAVEKDYPLEGGVLTVLRGVSFTIELGEFVAIVGPSGSGKSTLLTLLGCLENPTRGTLRVLDSDIARLNDDEISLLRARHIGFVFQSFNLLPTYDAVSNVALAALYAGEDNPFPRARALLQLVGLGHRLEHRPSAMSGGEKQRVAVARALMNDPRIILADEPTGALDQKNGLEVLAALQGLRNQGKTVIIVTHDLNVAARADRVLKVLDGVIVEDSSGGVR